MYKRIGLFGLELLLLTFLGLSHVPKAVCSNEFSLDYGCEANCEICYETQAGSCFLCDSSKIMDQYNCVTSGTGCSTGYLLDTDDKVCKKTRYEFEDPCPVGKYNPKAGRFDSSSECIDCPAGYYCPYIADPSPSHSKCVAGLYCLQGAKLGTGIDNVKTFQCPIGFYCPEGSVDKISCPPGRYCPVAGAALWAGYCEEGYYCVLESTTNRPTNLGTEGGNICPTGAYCVGGSSTYTDCPAGTYNPMQGGTKPENCLQCTAGYACPGTGIVNPSLLCTGGYYCEEGSVSQSPSGKECQPGYECPTGSAYPKKCDFHQVQPLSTQLTCTNCPIGSYCYNNQVKLCKKGHYCPGSNVVKPCPIGKWSPTEGLSAEAQCSSCTGGYACETPGIAVLNVKCDGGYYCGTGTSTRAPQSYKCAASQFCPAGSAAATPCTQGYWCGEDLLSVPSGLCQPGYYCPQGALTSTQQICGSGRYCPEGSYTPTLCPEGTYNPDEGAESVNDCVHCTMGQYCATTGLSSPTTDCQQGFYCPLKMNASSNPIYKCPKGHMCPTGSTAPKPCPHGYYQTSTQQWTCANCPLGNYCDFTDSVRAIPCPAGHYCPLRTYAQFSFPCPAGKYLDESGHDTTGDCKACGGGYYCPLKGMQAYFDPCPAGYYCSSGVSKPTDSNKCTKGDFCPSATQTPQGCYEGTYMDEYYTYSATECQPCPPGKYCAAIGKTLSQLQGSGSTYYGNCLQGYICYQGSYTPSPISGSMGTGCAKGHYCPTGHSYGDGILCARGKYQNQKYQPLCKDCKKGRFCDSLGIDTPSSCKISFYCPVGSKIETPCPPGKYSVATDLFASSDCADCPAGRYCEKPATTDGNLKCYEGFVCTKGSDSSMPSATDSANGKCTLGNYCGLGSSSPTQCPAGTFQNSHGGKACEDCPPGLYCGIGVSDPSGNSCPQDYKCPLGTGSPTDLCQTNYFCETGTADQFPCPDGTMSTTGMHVCDPCTQGNYCYRKADYTFGITPCPPHHYCETGSTYTGKICEAGTFTEASDSGKFNAAGCQDCITGKYCVDGKANGITLDDCNAGHFCQSKNIVPDPDKTSDPAATDLGTDDLCEPGKYCDAGTLLPTTCPASKFRKLQGARQSTDCTECELGYYCVTGNPIPIDCPIGHYCPTSSDQPTKCMKSTYTEVVKAEYSYDCPSCPPGYFCNELGIGDPTQPKGNYPCPESHYCYERSRVPVHCPAGKYLGPSDKGDTVDKCYNCPVGFYCTLQESSPIKCPLGFECLGGSIEPRKCEGGYYCDHDESGNWQKTVCPYSTYCPLQSKAPLPCPDNVFCLENSSYPQRCPFGMFMVATLPSHADAVTDVCYWCAAGEYSGDEKCEICEAGYICLGATIARFPLVKETDNGYECPSGYYCPAGIVSPIECSMGMYRATKIGKQAADCLPCPTNTYNDKSGQSQCTLCGSSARSLPGSSTCQCNGKYRAFNKIDASCRCIPAFEFTKEGVSSTTADGSTDCSPQIFDTCDSDSEYNYENKCVSKSDCSAQCPNGGGSIKRGICTCNDAKTADDYCGSACRSQVNVMTYTSNSYVQTNSAGVVVSTSVALNVFSGLGTSVNVQFKVSIFLSELGAISASYDPMEGVNRKRQLTSSGRFLQSETDIPTPVVCLQVGEGLTFAVSNTSYPVYLKDSLLNTVKEFDYGPFTLLQEKLTKTGLTIDTFLFRFELEGQYLFGEASDLNKQFLVKATNLDDCPDGFVQPLSDSSLEALGITPRKDIIHQREYWEFAIAALVILVVFAVLTLLVLLLCPKMIGWIKAEGTSGNKRDMSKFAELDEEQQYREMKEMLQSGTEGIDTMFFTFLRDKLREMDEKMKGAIENTNMKSMDRLKELIKRVRDLRDMFGSHYKALVLKNGMTIDEFIAAYEDQLHTPERDFNFLFADNTTESSSASSTSEKGPNLELEADAQSSHLSIEEENNQNIDDPNIEDGFDQTDHNDREKQLIEKNGMENEMKLDGELRNKRDEMRRVLELQGVDQEEIGKQLHIFTEKMQALKTSLDEDNQEQKDKLLARLKERQAKKKLGVAKASHVSHKAEETDTQYKRKLDKIKVEEKAELAHVEQELIALKKDGIELLKIQEKKKMEEIRAQLKVQLEGTTDPKEIERLLKRHESESRRIKDYLEIEREKQIHNLDAKLKSAKMQRKKKVMDSFNRRVGDVEEEKKIEMNKLELERIMVEGDHELEDFFGKGKNIFSEIEDIHNNKDHELDLQKEMEIEMLKGGNQNELNAIEKHYNMYEQETNERLRKDIVQLDKDTSAELEKLKKQFQRQLKAAPTSKEKTNLLQDYEVMKQKVADDLNQVRITQEKDLKLKLADRRRKKEIKLLREEKELEDAKLKKEVEYKQKSAENKRVLTIDAIFRMIEKDMNTLSENELPLLLQHLLKQKSDEELRELGNKQFYELSNSVLNLYTSLSKEKLIEKGQIQEQYERKYRNLDSQGLAGKKYQKEWMRLRKKEEIAYDRLEQKYENIEQEKEGNVRKNLTEKHCEEKLMQAQKEEEDKRALLEKLKRRLGGRTNMIEEISVHLIEQNAEDIQQRIKDIKREKGNSLENLKKKMFQDNLKEMEEIERKAQRDLDREEKELESKYKKNKENVIAQRKREFNEQLGRLNDLSGEQKAHLLKVYKRELEELENTLTMERDNQLTKMKEKLLNKKIQQERLKAKATQRKLKRGKSTAPLLIDVDEQRGEKEREEGEGDRGDKGDMGEIEKTGGDSERPRTERIKEEAGSNYRPLLAAWRERMEEELGSHQRERRLSDASINLFGERKDSLDIPDDKNKEDGGYVKMDELYEKVFNCEELAENVNDYEIPQIGKTFDKLVDFMDNVEKGQKRFGMATIGQSKTDQYAV